MARYSKFPASYPAVLHEYLRQDPPREAEITFSSQAEAKAFRFKFWGLRNALRLALDGGELNWKRLKDRAECTEAGLRPLADGRWVVRFTPKELVNAAAEYSIVYGRAVVPGTGLTMGEKELRELAEEGQRKLMERINSREADVRHSSSEGQSVPEKSLSELMQEEAERDDE